MTFTHQCHHCGKVVTTNSDQTPASAPCEFRPGSRLDIEARRRGQHHVFWKPRVVIETAASIIGAPVLTGKLKPHIVAHNARMDARMSKRL